MHLARNIMTKVPRGSQNIVAAALQSMFVHAEAQP